MAKVGIAPNGWRGKVPTYEAKVGTGSSTAVVIKRARRFEVGQRIDFVEVRELAGTAIGVAPKWKSGLIWKIEGYRLFIDLH